MADYSDPKRGVAYRFTLSLFARSNNQIKTTPTLAAGDVKVSKDNGATANITTLPSEAPASSGILQVDLSATEMTADLVTVTFIDASGAEWNDVAVHIAPAVRQLADLAYPTTSGRSIDVDASGGVEVGSFQAGAITAAAIATGAIDADALATDAVDEIVDAVWNEAQSGHTTAGTFGRYLDAQVANVETDTQDIQSRLPAALVSGRIDASVGAMAANVMTAAAAAADLTTELQSGLATSSAVSTLQTSVDDLPTNAELATALGTADDAVLAQVALVKAKTDNLPADPADASDIAARFTTLDTNLATVDTVVDAIKAKTDSLTFTVANKVDSNVKVVNDITVDGAGTSGDPWGPV